MSSILHRMEQWSATHHPAWLIVLRVALGLGLFVKGISFISDIALIQQWLQSSRITQPFPWLAYAVAWLHLFGGFMIIIGLFTRLMAALQIPILLGAILFILVNDGRYSSGGELGLAMAVLLLLVLFLVEGSGPVSLDHFFRHHEA